MPLDQEMAEIAQVFFAECRENLDVMESGLLRMHAEADADDINTVFRAAHSIKGGAATFGFTDVASFTHGVETLLDQMRAGRRAVSAETTQALLEASDCLREMMAATESDRPLDRERIASLEGRIERLLEAGGAPASAAATASTAPPSARRADPASWRIRLTPHPDFFKRGHEPQRLFQALEALGPVSLVPDDTALPTLESIDPALCYLAWNIELAGFVDPTHMEDVFSWVDDACTVKISPASATADPIAADPIAADPIAPGPVAPGPVAPGPVAPGPVAPGPVADELAGAPAHGAPASGAPATGASATGAAIAAGSLALAPLSGAAAGMPAPASAPGERAGSIRVATEKVDKIINLVGELLITQSMLGGFSDDIDVNDMNRLRQGLTQLARNTRQLQESVMQIRMLPISFAFNRFPRLVHDLSRNLGKRVELRLSGEHTELDKTVLEKISDPLVHLVRNALDHGLETPERRRAAGKSETGTLEMGAYHEGGNIIIEVSDDGAGLDRRKILDRARERQLVGADQELSQDQIEQLIFAPGFSTAERVSDVSGRGVGMDVVRRNINDLGGHVQIFSQEGAGSRIRIRLPLTLAILDGQLVRVGREVYVISLLAILETIEIRRERLSKLGAQTEVFRLRDEVLPVIRLYELFGIEPDSRDAEDGLLVVAEADGDRVGILVDDLMAQQQVVIKSLEANFKPVLGLAGATILGDGTVSLIIDVPGLIRAAGRARAPLPTAVERAA